LSHPRPQLLCSLTVNEVEGVRFGINLIPHTQQVTSLSGLEVGTRVNFEIDQIARYIERLIQGSVEFPQP